MVGNRSIVLVSTVKRRHKLVAIDDGFRQRMWPRGANTAQIRIYHHHHPWLILGEIGKKVVKVVAFSFDSGSSGEVNLGNAATFSSQKDILGSILRGIVGVDDCGVEVRVVLFQSLGDLLDHEADVVGLVVGWYPDH